MYVCMYAVRVYACMYICIYGESATHRVGNKELVKIDLPAYAREVCMYVVFMHVFIYVYMYVW